MSVQIGGNSKPVKEKMKVFISYSHADEKFLVDLVKHLGTLIKQGLIEPWDDRMIAGGEDWEKEIDDKLKSADIVLLLISSDFIHSDYCYGIEMEIALGRNAKSEAIVIPIIVRNVDWEHTPLSCLQALPRRGKAITEWDDPDAAFKDVATGVRQAVLKRLTGRPTGHSSLSQSDSDYSSKGRRNKIPDAVIHSNGALSHQGRAEKNKDTVQHTPALVNLDKKKESFGWREISLSLVFGAFLSGVNIVQRGFTPPSLINPQEKLFPIPILGTKIGQGALSLNLSMGISAFFLTAAMLLFLSYESEKISLFIKGVAREIAILYLIALAIIEVISHSDTFPFANPIIMLVISHMMFFIVGFIESIIDLKIAFCFNKISNNYKEHADIYRSAGRYAILTVGLNLAISAFAVLIYRIRGPQSTDEFWTLLAMTILNGCFLFNIRHKIEAIGQGVKNV